MQPTDMAPIECGSAIYGVIAIMQLSPADLEEMALDRWAIARGTPHILVRVNTMDASYWSDRSV